MKNYIVSLNNITGIMLSCIYLPRFKSFVMDKKQEFLNMVADKMLSIGCSAKVAEWIGFQFALESNFGRSRLATKKHNLCGMRVPMYRPSTNIGTTGFASYDSDEACLNDYCLWLSYNRFNVFDLRDLDTFQTKLVAKGYCPEPDYVQSITNLQNKTKF